MDRAYRFLIAMLALLLIVARFLPGTLPGFANVPDAGWAWAMSIATEQGRVFGRDVVFTYGPYAAVATHLYLPGLRGVILLGGTILGVAFAAGLVALRGPMAGPLIALLLPLAQTVDGLAFAIVLPALLLAASSSSTPQASRRASIALWALIPALALFPLIKCSLLAVTLIALACLCMLLSIAGFASSRPMAALLR
jgi:hypothetical protein